MFLCQIYSNITLLISKHSFLTPLPEYLKTRPLPNPKLSPDASNQIGQYLKRCFLSVIMVAEIKHGHESVVNSPAVVSLTVQSFPVDQGTSKSIFAAFRSFDPRRQLCRAPKRIPNTKCSCVHCMHNMLPCK